MTGILWVWTIFHLTQPIYSLNLPSCRAHRLMRHFDTPRLPNLPFARVFDEILPEKKKRPVDLDLQPMCSPFSVPTKKHPKNTQIQKKGHRLGSCVPDFYDRILMYIWWIWRKTVCPIIFSYSQPLKIIIWMTFRRFTDEKTQLFDNKIENFQNTQKSIFDPMFKIT